MTDQALARQIDPIDKVQAGQGGDRSDYLQHGCGILQPGVYLGSSPATTAGIYSDSRMCMSAGVRI